MPANTELSLDLSRLVELQRGLQTGALHILYQQCLADLGARVHALRRALDARLECAEEVAHALRGMAATYGLVGLERRLQGVMEAARDGDMATAAAAADGFEGALAHAAAAVHRQLRARADG